MNRLVISFILAAAFGARNQRLVLAGAGLRARRVSREIAAPGAKLLGVFRRGAKNRFVAVEAVRVNLPRARATEWLRSLSIVRQTSSPPRSSNSSTANIGGFERQRPVDVFPAQSGDLVEQVERLEHFLQVHQPDLPRPPFAFNHFAQRIGRAAMTAAGVEVREVDLSRGCGLAHPEDFFYCLAGFLNSKSIHCTAVAVVFRPERLRADTRSM